MKKILITGANSYIGTSFETYITEHYPDDYVVDTVDMIDGSWREKSFAGYDSVFHVAGIAHQKETKENAPVYYAVNRDLAVETAQKAKKDGVKQFVFLSSMSVYGMETGVITQKTMPAPISHYGKSKWQAEQKMSVMESDHFRICVLRPPMVYGQDCKGNYRALVKIAKMCPILPTYSNRRSMISINKLSECVREYIDANASGVFLPQDDSYVCTCEMIQTLRKQMGKRFVKVRVMDPFIKFCVKFTKIGRKAFGDLIYENA